MGQVPTRHARIELIYVAPVFMVQVKVDVSYYWRVVGSALLEGVRVILRVCVCVEHLNRCKTSKLAVCRGPGTLDCLSWPTKTRQHGGANGPANCRLCIAPG